MSFLVAAFPLLMKIFGNLLGYVFAYFSNVSSQNASVEQQLAMHQQDGAHSVDDTTSTAAQLAALRAEDQALDAAKPKG